MKILLNLSKQVMILINLNNFGKSNKLFLNENIFIRNYIVTEIMQATAIKNLLKEGVISNGRISRIGNLFD